MNNKKIILTIVLACALAIMLFFSFFNKFNFPTKKTSQVKTSQYFEGELNKRNFNFSINNQGNKENKFYVPVGKEINIQLRYNTDKSPIDPSKIEIIVRGANGEKDKLSRKFSKSSSSSYLYEAFYVGDKIGRDNILVAVDGTDFSFSGSVNFYDNSFTIPSNIDENNVTFEEDGLLKIDNKKIESPNKIDSFSENFFDGFEHPGKVVFNFSPIVKNEANKKARLEVFSVSSDMSSMYNSEYISEYQPFYLANYKSLKKALASYPKKIEDQILPDFPPINASRGGTFHPKYIKFKNGIGLRFLIPGYFQAVEEAENPTYVFQGITNDGRHHIVFRYENVYSPALDDYLDGASFDYSNPDKWIPQSFDAVETENEDDFLPNITKIDNFISSIKID